MQTARPSSLESAPEVSVFFVFFCPPLNVFFGGVNKVPLFSSCNRNGTFGPRTAIGPADSCRKLADQ